MRKPSQLAKDMYFVNSEYNNQQLKVIAMIVANQRVSFAEAEKILKESLKEPIASPSNDTNPANMSTPDRIRKQAREMKDLRLSMEEMEAELVAYSKLKDRVYESSKQATFKFIGRIIKIGFFGTILLSIIGGILFTIGFVLYRFFTK